MSFIQHQLLIRLLKLHNLLYRLITRLAIKIEGGSHPKHRLMRYEDWFVEHIEPGSVVLDVGCNTGAMALRLSEKAAFVYGIEINPLLCAEAERRHAVANLKFICADATTFDYCSCQAIDHVTLSNVLEHIDDRSRFLRRLLEQVVWRLPQTKSLLIRVPMVDRDWLTLYKKELGVDYRLDPTHYTEYTQRQFEQELSAAGVTVTALRICFGEIYAVCRAI